MSDVGGNAVIPIPPLPEDEIDSAETVPNFSLIRSRVLPIATCNNSERPDRLSGHKSVVVGRYFYVHHICGLFAYDFVTFRWNRLRELPPPVGRSLPPETVFPPENLPVLPGRFISSLLALQSSQTSQPELDLLPPSRRNHSFHYIPHLNCFLIFGGIHQRDTALAQVQTGDRLLNDVFLYDLESSCWYNVTPRLAPGEDGYSPISRCSHVSFFRRKDRSFYVYGGILKRRRFGSPGELYMHRLEISGEPGEGPESRMDFFLSLGDRIRWKGWNVLRRMTLEQELALSPLSFRQLLAQDLALCTPLFPLGNGGVLTHDESEMIFLFGLKSDGMNVITYAYSFEKKHFRVLPTFVEGGSGFDGFEVVDDPSIEEPDSPSFDFAVRHEGRLGALFRLHPPPHPPPRVYFGYHRFSRDSLIVYGGEQYGEATLGSKMVGDMYILNIRTRMWRKVVEAQVDPADHVERVVPGRGPGGEKSGMQTLQARTNCAIQRRGRFLYLFGGGLGDRWRTNAMFLVDLRDYTLFFDGASDPAMAGDWNCVMEPFALPSGFVDVLVICQT